MMKPFKALVATTIITTALFAPLSVSAADKLAVNITKGMGSVDVMHNGKKVTIMRNQDQKNTINKAFAKTSRKCPPFCIQPATLAPGVETIAEVEVIDYLQKMNAGDKSILVVDSRGPEWAARGTIPGSVNVPWRTINTDMAGMFAMEGEAETLKQVLSDTFGAKRTDSGWDFSGAKTLVLFCNGLWCGQSSINIKTLAKLGYPTEKLKWYRGGMQDWVSVGLTTVTP